MNANVKRSLSIAKSDSALAGIGEEKQTKTRTRCANRGKRKAWQDRAALEVADAAMEIIRANVEKAKAGSLSHTKWLWSLADQTRHEQDEMAEISLAEFLLKQLHGSH